MTSQQNRLLVIEADDTSRHAFSRLAQGICKTVDSTATYEVAEQALCRCSYDIIFLSLDRYPASEGLKLVSQLKGDKSQRNGHAYLIAAGTDLRLENLLQGDADTFLLKPFTTEKYRETLRFAIFRNELLSR